MKGINKRVIEITEPENELIEKVIVFIKPGNGDVRLMKNKQQAESYVASLICRKRSNKKLMWLFAAGVAAVLAFAALIWLF